MPVVGIDSISNSLIISFSGGRSSAVMTKLLLDKYGNRLDINVLFANTGCEHPETLEFVRKCDEIWNFGTIWLEGQYNSTRGIGPKSKVVNYETASREGRPFREYLEAYQSPHQILSCTRDLKIRPIQHWMRENGYSNRTTTAIGIRADEIDRAENKDRRSLAFPLLEWGYTKEKVRAFMGKAPFDLDIPEHYGNCVFCWKKSMRKLLTIAAEQPEFFAFPQEQEAKHPEWRWYRGNITSGDILSRAKTEKFNPYKESGQMTIFDLMSIPDLDLNGGCGETCHAF